MVGFSDKNCGLMVVFHGILWDFMGFYGILWDVPSSNLLTAKITIEIVDISMNNGDFPQLS